MNQGISSSHPTKQLCEAFGCSTESTLEISVNAGRHGIISLKVCKNCLVRFHDANEDSRPSKHTDDYGFKADIEKG
jgi:hypothetical protein